MNKTAALLVGCLTVATVSAAPSALAAPKKKPITGSYTATAPTPDPTNFVPGKYPVCAQNVPGSYDAHPFTVPAKGTLHIDLTGFVGDWDLLLVDADKAMIGESGNTPPVNEETVDVSFKKSQKVSIIACNWAGGSTGNVKYVFTYK